MHRSGAAMAWNVFKFCTALRGLGSIMILLVLGIVGVTYYAVVLSNYGPALYVGDLDSLISFAVLILFHCLLVMLLWSYFAAVFTDPGIVPPNWKPAFDEERGEADPLNGLELSNMQSDPSEKQIRYCRKCSHPKPARCHHCSVCGRCVLKMDHHCVWVVNCVGALNYKYFLLFLFYTFLETTLVTLSLLPQFKTFFSDGEIPGTPGTLATTFLTFVLNLAFTLSVLGFLIMHISLVAANTTTIEAYEKKTTPKWRYDLGLRKNFEQYVNILANYFKCKRCSGPCTVDFTQLLVALGQAVDRRFQIGKHRFLGWTRDTGSSLLIQKKIYKECQFFRALSIHQNRTSTPKISES